MHDMLNAIKGNDTLIAAGSVTEFLPQYAEMTYTFNEGLTARIADHGNGSFQMTLGGFLDMEPTSPQRIVAYLANLD